MMRRAGLALLGALASASPSLAAVCSLTGDTHISPFPGSSYQDLYSPNYYEVLAFNLNDPRRRLEVQANQAYGAWGGNTINNDLAVRCGLDMIVFQQKRDGAVPTMTLNGQVITMAPGTSRLLPSAPADAKDRYYVYFRQDSAWDSIDVDCNVRGNRDDYAYGMKVHMDWYRPFNLGYGGSSSAYVHGNLYVEQQDTYANRNQAGVCGFVPGVNSRNVNHFITYESSLFGKTPRDHANEAKAGRGITDPKALEDARATCARSVFQVTGVTIDKIGEWFKGMDASVQENMKNFIEGCAVDVYFGQGYDSSEVVNQVCSYVSLARDSAYQDIVRQTALIRDCSKEPFVDPATLIPFLEVKFRLYQFCNKSPPKERDPLPKGQGFDPTCAQLKAGAEKITESARAAAAEEAALAAKAEQMKQEAAQEQQAKAIERARMEQETKKIEAERVATAEKENKARADIEKRAADAAAGAAVPLPAVSGLKAGTRMTQKSKVFMMDASKAAFNPLTRRPTGIDGSESS